MNKLGVRRNCILLQFVDAALVQAVATDYTRFNCITSIFIGFLGRSQPLPLWKAFLSVFSKVCSRNRAILMSRENETFLKQVAFHLLRLGVFQNQSIQKRVVVGLQILIRVRSLFELSCIPFLFVVNPCCYAAVSVQFDL